MNGQLMYGGGHRYGHTHLAVVSHPIKKNGQNNGTCPACIAIEGFLLEARQSGWVMTQTHSDTVWVAYQTGDDYYARPIVVGMFTTPELAKQAFPEVSSWEETATASGTVWTPLFPESLNDFNTLVICPRKLDQRVPL